MSAGITDRLWTLDDIVAKIEEMAPPPAKRGPYKKAGGMMAVIGLLVAIIAGWMGVSGWWSIPIGIALFVGGRRALPDQAHRVNSAGIPIYILGAFLIMKLVGWLHSLIA